MIEKIKDFNKKYNLILLYIIALLFPLNKKLLPILLIVFIVLNINKSFWNNIKNNIKSIIFLSTIYILYLIGLFYTDNFKFAFLDLQIKLSLLVIPMLFVGIKEKLNKTVVKNILMFFVMGVFISFLISTVYGLYRYNQTQQLNYLFYSEYSLFLHPSYAALYVCLAYISIFWIIENFDFSKMTKILLYFILVCLIFKIVMLGSKAGFIGLIITIIMYLFYLIVFKKKYLQSLLITITFTITLFGALKSLDFIMVRLNEAISVVNAKDISENKGGSAARLMIWSSAIEIIKENPLIGVGTGDVKDELIKKYEKNNVSAALERKLNAHNQYLQTFVTLGIFGILSLLILLLYPFWISFKNKDYLYFTFIIVFAFNIAVESMLEVQAGVMFFAFFNSLFFVYFIPKKT